MLTGQHLPREGVPVVHSGQSRTDRQTSVTYGSTNVGSAQRTASTG